MKEELNKPLGVIMAIVASAIWVVWCILAVIVMQPPLAKASAALVAVLMYILVRGIALRRLWARWTAFSVLATLGLFQGFVMVIIISSLLRHTGPKPVSASPIPIAIPLLLSLFCLASASLLLRKKEGAYFKASLNKINKVNECNK